MKKVVLASLLACAAIATGLPSANAQTAVNLGTKPAGPAPCPPMPEAEYPVFNTAQTATTPQAQAAGYEAYLTQFPNSCYKPAILGTLMATYVKLNDNVKTLDAADRLLAVDPNNFSAILYETFLRKLSADSIADPAGKQAALDAAAGFAQKGLVAPKPAEVTDDQFKAAQAGAFPVFYGAIGTAALNKKDTAAAITAFKQELASVPVTQTQAPGPVLQDTFFLANAYLTSTPPDLLNCAFYAARFVDYAPEPYKTQYTPTAKYCYKQYHGTNDGYDAFAALAKANPNPPAYLASTITPAPTPAEQIHTILTSTPDLQTLATSDKEMVFQFGSAEDAAKVWDTVKGKSYQFPDTLVIESSPTVLKVAIDAGAQQSKTADFTFNMTPLEDIPEPKATATPAAKAAYKKAMAERAAITAAIAVGQKVTLTGTYDSFVPSPLMIVMKDGAVILPKAAAAKPAAPAVRRPAAKQ
jgi:hypothetical protein